jgi:hypothetical protein
MFHVQYKLCEFYSLNSRFKLKAHYCSFVINGGVKDMLVVVVFQTIFVCLWTHVNCVVDLSCNMEYFVVGIFYHHTFDKSTTKESPSFFKKGTCYHGTNIQYIFDSTHLWGCYINIKLKFYNKVVILEFGKFGKMWL